MLSPSSDSSELSNWWPVTLHGDGFGGILGVGSGAGAGLVEPSVELAGVLACVCLAGFDCSVTSATQRSGQLGGQTVAMAGMKVVSVERGRSRAEQVASYLRSEGIPARVDADDAGGVLPGLGGSLRAKVLVPEADEERASDLLASAAEAELPATEEDAGE